MCTKVCVYNVHNNVYDNNNSILLYTQVVTQWDVFAKKQQSNKVVKKEEWNICKGQLVYSKKLKGKIDIAANYKNKYRKEGQVLIQLACVTYIIMV